MRILMFFLVVISSISFSETICNLPKPTSVRLIKESLKKEIDDDIFDCLKENISNPDSEYWLSVFYTIGIIVPKDIHKGYQYAYNSALKGQMIAAHAVAGFYEKGIAVSKDLFKAIYWYEKSISLGYELAMENLVQVLLKTKDIDNYIKAKSWAEKSASLGHITSTFNLATIYARGLGLEKDYLKAFQLYLKLADMGVVEAQSIVGEFYLSKYPKIPFDEEKALLYTSAACNKGYWESCNTLGVIYFKGLGVQENKEKAFKIFSLMAEKNNTKSQINLADFYNYGLGGLKKNSSMAQSWYLKSLNTTNVNDINKYKSSEEIINNASFILKSSPIW